MIQHGMRALGAAWLLLMSCSMFAQTWRGVDASFLPELFVVGLVYSTVDGVVIDESRTWMRDQGVNAVRLRVWHNPLEDCTVPGWRWSTKLKRGTIWALM